ncbi:site-specific integrase [Streptomyces xanthophaeus]
MDSERKSTRKAANGEDSIYWDKSKGRFVGAVSLGYTASGKRNRAKVSGATKTEVRRKLRDLKRELEQGSRTIANYTVEQAVDDWLAQGLRGRADGSVYTYRSLARTHITPEIGRTKLKLLEADDVDTWLDGRAELIATASLKLLLSVLRRSIAHAQRRGRVVRNVADYVVAPEGRPGRPSKSLSLSQAESILRAEAGTWIHAYVVLALLVGTRPEETRPLTWQHVRLDSDGDEKPHVQVWRSVRRHGEMKTHKSRRSLAMPRHVVAVMKVYREQQQAALEGSVRSLLPGDLVFPHPSGKLRTAQDVRRNFRGLLKEAGLPDPDSWTTRELRTSFVSLLSDHGLRIEDIARLVGHSGSSTTERVYRKQLRPVIEAGAEAMDAIFSEKDDLPGPE